MNVALVLFVYKYITKRLLMWFRCLFSYRDIKLRINVLTMLIVIYIVTIVYF